MRRNLILLVLFALGTGLFSETNALAGGGARRFFEDAWNGTRSYFEEDFVEFYGIIGQEIGHGFEVGWNESSDWVANAGKTVYQDDIEFWGPIVSTTGDAFVTAWNESSSGVVTGWNASSSWTANAGKTIYQNDIDCYGSGDCF